MLLDTLSPFPLFIFTNVLSSSDFPISHPCIVVNDLSQRDFSDIEGFAFIFFGAGIVGLIFLRYILEIPYLEEEMVRGRQGLGILAHTFKVAGKTLSVLAYEPYLKLGRSLWILCYRLK